LIANPTKLLFKLILFLLMPIVKKKLVRITTVPLSIDKLLGGQLSYMNSFYEVTAISSEIEYLKRCALAENVKFHHLEMTRKITPLKDLIALIKLFIYLKNEKPEMVHSHTPKAGMLAMIAAKLAGVPIRLHTVGGLPLMETKGLKRKILKSVEKLTYACATAVYPNAYGLYDFIIENKLTSPKKLKVIANGSTNGINTNYFSVNQISQELKQSLKDDLKIQESDFIFVFVGRIVGDKGINELIQAFKRIMNNDFNIKLLLVGEEENEIDPLNKETQQELFTNRNIIKVGWQKDIRPYLALSDVLILPTYREGFPNVVMQAGAMGLPTIVSNINGCNEIVEDGKNGIIIPVKNVIAIEEAVFKIKNDKIFFNNLKKNSREMITSRYEQQLVWNAILAEYQNLDLQSTLL
jgi:glycosyltransferase involved in cell wall biosynthesis